MATSTSPRPVRVPEIQSVTAIDPEGRLTVRLATGALRVVFCGDDDLPNCVTIATPTLTNRTIPTDEEQITVNGVRYFLTVRLELRQDPDDAAPAWHLARGNRGYYSIRRVDRSMPSERPSDAATRALHATSKAVAAHAAAIMPYGWAAARAAVLADQLVRDQRASERAAQVYDDAVAAVAQTRSALAAAQGALNVALEEVSDVRQSQQPDPATVTA